MQDKDQDAAPAAAGLPTLAAPRQKPGELAQPTSTQIEPVHPAPRSLGPFGVDVSGFWPITAWQTFAMPTSDPVGTQPPDAESIVPELIDRAHHAAIARATGGVSPAALMEAYFDWLLHLSLAPGKQLQLIQKAVRKSTRLQAYGLRCLATGAAGPPCIQPLQQDKRFNDDEWQALPWSMMSQSFLLTQQWWHNATTGVPGVSKQHERMLDFAARQILDIIAPSNFLATNPVLMKETARQGGANLARGFQNALQDAERRTNKRPPAGADAFQAGRDVALTPGKVVFRNELIELIQYEPQTPEVQKEPILIVPAWIMKYYILDLEPRNSLVRYLVSQGHTVFMISWKNPSSGDRDFRMDDYRKLGIMNALDAVCQVIPDRKIHTAGYCLGGTLLAIAAAAMARDDDHRLASVTFLAAQIDFTEPGELQLFINESQVRFLEDLMWEQGYLDTTQMAGAFRMLRSRDLIWSRMVREYVLGERGSMNALMAWNADGTRMPYAMHSEYLRRLFLNNDLAEGRYPVDGRPIAVTDIRAPIFSVGTTTDHVAPWRSVYKINLLADTEVTFVLTTGGHNAGIVSEPGHPRRSYQVASRNDAQAHLDPDNWMTRAPRNEGSWWPEWSRWLIARSSGLTSPPRMGCPDTGLLPLCDAPGTYVMMR